MDRMDKKSNFGAKLRNLRVYRRMTTQELADKAGMSQSYISKLEGGYHPNPNAGVVKKLAAALDVSPGQLLYDAAYIPNEVIENLPQDLQEWLASKTDEKIPYIQLIRAAYENKIPIKSVEKAVNLLRDVMEDDKKR